jgi:quinolinate synthase
MGKDLCIMAHHYQEDRVVAQADIVGDSLELARQIPGLEARNIIICGVYFMAESAAILARQGQKVFIPDREAGCLLSNMAPAPLVESMLKKLVSGGRRIVPLAYVNTSAAVKEVCGRYGGSVCTSANASTMLRWALDQGDGVLFLPDKNLARNTANKLGLPDSSRDMLKLRDNGFSTSATLYIWPGVCVVHQLFKPQYLERIRAEEPGAKIIVHPECSPELVGMADASGSTSQIIRYVQEAEEGSTIYVGTECNLVERLTDQYQGEKQVLPLHRNWCSNMAKINEDKLAQVLQNLDTAEPIEVSEEVRVEALRALERMLEACS